MFIRNADLGPFHQKSRETKIVQVKKYEPRRILITQEGEGDGGTICMYGLKSLDHFQTINISDNVAINDWHFFDKGKKLFVVTANPQLKLFQKKNEIEFNDRAVFKVNYRNNSD